MRNLPQKVNKPNYDSHAEKAGFVTRPRTYVHSLYLCVLVGLSRGQRLAVGWNRHSRGDIYLISVGRTFVTVRPVRRYTFLYPN